MLDHTPAGLTRRAAARRVLAPLTLAALGAVWPARAGGVAHSAQSALSADARIFESTTTHNSFPDDCGMRLDRLFIAEDLELSIRVQFSRTLSEAESGQVQWAVAGGMAEPSSGTFAGQPNPALITTRVKAGADTDTTVSLTYQGADLVTPLPMRVISNAEYDAALATLTRFIDDSPGPQMQLPLTTDLLARFLGRDSSLAGTPVLGAVDLSICDARLTQRAGAPWGSDTVATVPLVHYAADQPASAMVAEGVAAVLLRQNSAAIRQYFAANPTAAAQRFEDQFSSGLALNYPLDALFALHSVQFDGTVAATVEAPSGPLDPLTARQIEVRGTVEDLYDFALETSGPGAFPAAEAARVQIASAKHAVGKVFVVSFALDQTLETLRVGAPS